MVKEPDNRECMAEKLAELKFPRIKGWTDRFLDIMIFFGAILNEYIEHPYIYPFIRTNDFCRIVNMDEGRAYTQPETGDNWKEKENGELAEIVNPYDMYLYYKMDQVLSFHFKKEDVNAGEFCPPGYHYIYKPKQETDGLDWIIGIRFWEADVFPTVELNEALFDEDESKPWHGMAVSIQEELPKFYKDLQEAYGKKAYADPDYTGKDFLIYSEVQADFLIQTLLSVFCPDGRKMWVLA